MEAARSRFRRQKLDCGLEKSSSWGEGSTWEHVLKSELLTPETAVMKQMQRTTRMDSLQGSEARAMTGRCQGARVAWRSADNQNLEFGSWPFLRKVLYLTRRVIRNIHMIDLLRGIDVDVSRLCEDGDDNWWFLAGRERELLVGLFRLGEYFFSRYASILQVAPTSGSGYWKMISVTRTEWAENSINDSIVERNVDGSPSEHKSGMKIELS